MIELTIQIGKKYSCYCSSFYSANKPAASRKETTGLLAPLPELQYLKIYLQAIGF
jgi:hypothetical protein